MDGRRLVLGVGQAAFGNEHVDLVLDLGPHHPTSHGLLTLSVALGDDDRITQVDVGAAHLHRGAEKLFEVRDYRQIMVLANRHDWLSAFSGELGVALAVERQLGLEVPVRATWIRTAMAELGRILHHLSFVAPLATYTADVDQGVALSSAISDARDGVLAAMESASGGRIHVMATRIGGLRRDIPADWTAQVRSTADSVAVAYDLLADAWANDDALAARYADVGLVAPELVDAYGLSGVLARASGVDLDLRRDDPYLAYRDLADELTIPTASTGDALSRIRLLVEQVDASRQLVVAATQRIDQLGPGPVDVLLPKVLRVPEGTSAVSVEAPGGISGYVLVSRGDKAPWRLKLRSASFSNASVLPSMLLGARVEDVVPILQSMQLIAGDLSK